MAFAWNRGSWRRASQRINLSLSGFLAVVALHTEEQSKRSKALGLDWPIQLKGC